MDDTHSKDDSVPEPSVMQLGERLESVDPADAPPVAEELADRLSEALDAAGGELASERERSD